MDLNSSVAQFASGGAIKNSVGDSLADITTQSATLGSIGSLPGLDGIPAVIDAMKASVQAKWTAMLAQLPVALPLLKAVHVHEKKMEMIDGGISSSAASSTFDSYFGSMDAIKSAMSSLGTSVTSAISSMGSAAVGIAGVSGTGPAAITSLAAHLPSQTIPDPSSPGSTITNPAYTSFMSTNGTAIGSLTTTATGMSSLVASTKATVEGHFAAADGAYASGIGKLKGMAFAQFCAMPQPPPVRDVISKTVVTTSIPRVDDIAQVQRTGSGWLGSQTVAVTREQPAVAAVNPELCGAKPIVSATAYVPTQSSLSQLHAIRDQIDSQHTVLQTASDSADEAGAALSTWMKSVNYAEAKNNRVADPDTYAALSAQASLQPSYAQVKQRMAIYNAEKAKLLHLRDVQSYMFNTGPWPGNPDGPW